MSTDITTDSENFMMTSARNKSDSFLDLIVQLCNWIIVIAATAILKGQFIGPCWAKLQSNLVTYLND